MFQFVNGDRVRYNEEMMLMMGDFGLDEGIVISAAGDKETVTVEWANGDRLVEKVEDLELVKSAFEGIDGNR